MELPRCLVKAMPALTLQEDEKSVTNMFHIAQPSHPASRRARAAAALVPLALLVLAATAGLLWRRQRLHERSARRLHERSARRLHKHAEASEVCLLEEPQAGAVSKRQHDMPQTVRGSSSCSRRHRIESMLLSQLSRPGQRIELVPLERLPAALTHQVGSLRRGSRPMVAAAAAATTTTMPAGGYARLQAVDEGQQHNSWGRFGSGGSRNSNAGLLETGAAGPPASRQRGLPTDSLRLAPGELEMQTAPDGRLCLLGEGSSCAVYLGRLGGYEDVAVKVSWVCSRTPEQRSAGPLVYYHISKQLASDSGICCVASQRGLPEEPARPLLPVRILPNGCASYDLCQMNLTYRYQVAELAPGMDSRHVWDEASLLRTCVHRRLVALLGVACQVIEGGVRVAAQAQPCFVDAHEHEHGHGNLQ